MSTEELQLQHEQWLANPVTRQAMILMKKREEEAVNAAGKASFNEDDITLRSFMNQFRCLQATNKLLFDTKTFINQTLTDSKTIKD